MIPNFEHHRFDLSYFLNTCADEAGPSCAASLSSDSKAARVHQKAFQDLVEMFSINIQKHLKDAGWRRVLHHKIGGFTFLG